MRAESGIFEWDSEMRRERADVLVRAVKNALGEPAGHVLDFGCGTGLISFGLADFAGAVYGTDTSQERSGIFLAKKNAFGAENVHFIFGEEMKRLSFDAVICSMVLHHIADVPGQIVELKALLKEGGAFIWIDLDEDDGSFHKNEPGFQGHNGFARGDVEKLLKNAGFANVGVETAYEGEKIIDGNISPYSLFMALAKC